MIDQSTRTKTNTDAIRTLNDALRTTGKGGLMVVTDGIAAQPPEDGRAIYKGVAEFTDFNNDNDPWGEHDCASLAVGELRIIWKIDYFDRARRRHSPDPADPTKTVRVLTIMLAEEY